jgi:hypothetical protein
VARSIFRLGLNDFWLDSICCQLGSFIFDSAHIWFRLGYKSSTPVHRSVRFVGPAQLNDSVSVKKKRAGPAQLNDSVSVHKKRATVLVFDGWSRRSSSLPHIATQITVGY